ncbi:MAG: GNAT family N-acetyltransferase [Deltaproteobacteria bacterium]|nr:GNAT family N-acetyltransferase [Deltaproteobacteria bacterium]MBI3390898.1 GNAT family N-acetyltransferase [Deltaproteobacteria bacterium]
MNSLDELRTARLRLTRMQASDVDDLARMHRDPQVMATLGGVRSAAETTQIVERLVAHWAQQGFGYWLVRDLATDRFAGRGGLRHVAVGEREEVEVAYALMPEFWRRGLATELARECVRVGFAELQRADLVCFTLTTNRASQRVMECAGFVYERDVIYADLPHVLYRQTAVAWRARAGS